MQMYETSPRRVSMVWRLITSIEGLALVLLGGAGLIVLAANTEFRLADGATVGFLPLNWAHSALLIAAAALTVVFAYRHDSILMWSLLTCAAFTVLFLYGTAQSTAQKSSTWLWLDPPENFLHAGIAIVSFVILCAAGAVPWWRQRRDERLIGAKAPHSDRHL